MSATSFAYHVGRTVGKYKLESLLGRGGMAEVYKSHHPELGRELAIKIVHPFLSDTPGFLERFRREARTVAALRHPNIVQVFDFDVTPDGLHYMVLEFINGQSLEHYLAVRGNVLAVPEATFLFTQVADAVHYAHQQQMIHRDIKPANILVNQAGQAFLTDFGIAQLLGDSRLTNTGLATGTPDYMAPEQVLNQPVTPATDIYALGGLLYKMVTGHRPFEGENGPTLMMRRLNEAPEPPHKLVPDLNPGVERVILKALQKNPQNRYQDAAAMSADLLTQVEADLLGPPITRPVTQPGIPAPHPPTPYVNTRPSSPADPIPTPYMMPNPAAAMTPPTPAPTPSQLAFTEVNPTPTPAPSLTPMPTPVPQAEVRSLPTWVWPMVAIAAITIIALALIFRQPPTVVAPPVTASLPAAATSSADPSLTPAVQATASSPAEIPGMVFIPGGSFVMGNATGNADEAPAHPVDLSPYYLDITEVTNSAYAEFVAATGYLAPTHWQQAAPSLWQITATTPFALGDPENRFDYGGVAVNAGEGSLTLDLDADNDTGTLVATFTGTIQAGGESESVGGVEAGIPTFTGEFRIEQTSFQGDNAPFKEGGIADFVVMHGNSGNETPRYPEMEAYLATWGTADVYLDGELLFADLGIHVMYNDGVRDHSNHFLPRTDGSCCFNPASPEDKQVNAAAPVISLCLFADAGGGSYDAATPIWVNLYYTNITVTAAPEQSSAAAFPPEQAELPVTNVTYDDAAAYCSWRGSRLPTEAEWEYGARGREGFLYPWGNQPNFVLANINDHFAGLTTVGNFPDAISPFGLTDMAGNAWEWVADWYAPDYYTQSPQADPLGPASGTLRLVRGGSFRIFDITGLDESRATHRRPLEPSSALDDVGFRCAANLP